MTVALDGNAIGGLLHEIFGAEMTDAAGECAHCHVHLVVAECEVYLDAPGVVVRCRTCGSVLMVVVRGRSALCVDIRGVDALLPSPV